MTAVKPNKTPIGPVARIQDLAVAFPSSQGERRAVDGVSVELTRGTVTGLAGESGSGKSMTALALCGLLPPNAKTSGQIHLGERQLLGADEATWRNVRGREIAMIFQDPIAAFHPMLSIGRQLTDHVRHHLDVGRRGATGLAMTLLERVQVPDPQEAMHKYPHQFSGGQLQRIGIAGALACDPQVLVADEPTTALDVTVQAGVLRLLRTLCDETGIAVLFITHDLGVMSAIADDVVIMKDGKVVEAGQRRQVLTSPNHPYTQGLIDALPTHERPGVLARSDGQKKDDR